MNNCLLALIELDVLFHGDDPEGTLGEVEFLLLPLEYNALDAVLPPLHVVALDLFKRPDLLVHQND